MSVGLVLRLLGGRRPCVACGGRGWRAVGYQTWGDHRQEIVATCPDCRGRRWVRA